MNINNINCYSFRPFIRVHSVKDRADISNVSFKGIDNHLLEDTFISSKQDLLTLSESEIIEKVNQTVANKNNYLGCGSEAVVYRIPDTDYCVRLKKNNKSKLCHPVSFKLSTRDKINHVVAKIGKNAAILKFYEGFPSFVMNESNCKIIQSEVDKSLDELPVSAFSGLLRQVCFAKKHDMVFDCDWSNVIINPENKTITAIDFYKLDKDMPEVIYPLRACYSSLIYPEAPVLHKKNCMAKILLAALEEMKPGEVPCMPVEEFNFSDFINKVYSDKNMSSDAYTDLLKKIMNDIECLKIKNIYNKDDKNIQSELNGKIKVAQFLIKQTLLPSYESNTIPVIDDKEIYNL